jgi:hypothetical protein
VRCELLRAATAGELDADRVLREDWLGDPVEPDEDDMLPIVSLQIAIGGDPQRNAGEAETIYFAERLGGSIVTDDNAAYQFAASRPTLGRDRVLDTIRILTDLVTAEVISPEDAVTLCREMRSAGRNLRRTHPISLTPRYFRVA